MRRTAYMQWDSFRKLYKLIALYFVVFFFNLNFTCLPLGTQGGPFDAEFHEEWENIFQNLRHIQKIF